MPWVIKRVFMAEWQGNLPGIKHTRLKCSKCKEIMEPSLGTWHYVESGQDGIYLDNIRIWTCGQGHQAPEIPRAVELHKLFFPVYKISFTERERNDIAR